MSTPSSHEVGTNLLKEHISTEVNETSEVKQKHRKTVNKVLGKYIILNFVL